jgi:hypothetical protein
MGWSSTARRAAAEEYGKANWRRYAARRRAAATFGLLLAGLALLVWAVRATAHAVGPVRMSMPDVAWGRWLAVTGSVLVVLFVGRLVVRMRRPYRMPRRRLFRFRRW